MPYGCDAQPFENSVSIRKKGRVKKKSQPFSWFTMVHYGSLWSTMVHYGSLWFTMVHYGPLWSTTCCSSTFRPPRCFVMLSFPRCCRTTSSSGRIGGITKRDGGGGDATPGLLLVQLQLGWMILHDVAIRNLHLESLNYFAIRNLHLEFLEIF